MTGRKRKDSHSGNGRHIRVSISDARLSAARVIRIRNRIGKGSYPTPDMLDIAVSRLIDDVSMT